MKEEIATIFEKMRTRECLDCGVVGFAGPPTAEHCHECDLKYLKAKATAVYGGGGLTVLAFE